MSHNHKLPLSHAQKGIWLGQQKLADSPCYNTGELLCFEAKINIERLISAVALVISKAAALNMVFHHGEAALEQCYMPNALQEKNKPSENGAKNTTPERSNQEHYVDAVKLTDIKTTAPQPNAYNPQIIRFDNDELLDKWIDYWLLDVMDLSNNRPFRHAFIQRPNGQYAWFIQIHHIACDGFSYALLSKQLKQAYENPIATSQPSIVEEIKQGFNDYKALIKSANDYEVSEQCAADRTYWQQQFLRHNPISFRKTLINDIQPAIARREYLNLKPEFLTILKNQAQEIQHDWPTLLKAYVTKWFSIATSQTCLTFGCPEMNRPFGPAMRFPALQMNILPLTLTLDHNEPILDIARRIQEQQRANKAHARYRYEHFSSDIKSISQNPKPTRTFGPIINILPFDRNLSIDDCKVSVQPLAAGPVEDMAIYFSLADTGQLQAFIEFHPELYNEDECRWLSENLGHWLNNAIESELKASVTSLENNAAKKTQPVKSDAHELASSQDQIQSILRAPIQSNAKNLFERLEYQRANFGQKAALSWFDEQLDEPTWQSINYQTLCTYIADTAQTFAQAGLRSGQKCVIASGRGPWSIISMFACLALNAEFIGIDIDGPAQRLQTIINDANARLVIVNDVDWLTEKQIELPAHASVLTVEHIKRLAENSKIHAAAAMEVFIQNAAPSLAAYSIYTSGSTGTPKAVQVSQQALIDFIDSANCVYQITQNDHVLQFAPLHFDACIEEIFISLCFGATLSIRSKAMVESFNAFNDTLKTLEITFLDLPTAFWHEWVKFNSDFDITPALSISRVIIGGEACKPSAIAEFFKLKHSAKLINTYGPSEATVVATTKILDHDNYKHAHPATIGKPLPGRSLFILDEALNPLPKGARGQLALAGNSLASGYFGQKALSAEKFISLTVNGKQIPAYLTGDIAAINQDDEVIFYGRIDDEIKISGQRIHPTEICTAIESELNGHQVAIIPIKRDNQYQIIAVIAHLSLTTWQPYPNSHSLKLALSSKLPSVQIPSLIFETNKLPLTSAGKVDRKQLKAAIEYSLAQALTDLDLEKCNQTSTSLDNLAASTTTLPIVLDVWREILGLSNIAANDDFFVLGGTSLQLLQVATRLSQKLASLDSNTATRNEHNFSIGNFDITVSKLFKYPKAIELAKHLDTSIYHKGNKPENTTETPFEPPKLPPELCHRFRPRNTNERKQTILLTGATGFVGAQLLTTLLAADEVDVVSCVVRADSINAARLKIASACRAQSLQDASQSEKLQIILGDLAREDWGLSAQELQAIAKPITAVIHNGAVTSVVRDYQSLKAVNVDATQTAMKIAHISGAPLHYISTIAIGDKDSLPEEFVEFHPYLLDGYQQSKWASESLLATRSAFGQPISIYRLPRVVGDSKIGAINPKDLIWQIAAASSRAGFMPELDFSEPWLAANEAAEFIVTCMLKQKHGIYNCVPNKQVSIKQVLNKIQSQCDLSFLPIDQWLSAIAKSLHSEDQALHAFFTGLNGKAAALPMISTKHFIAEAQPNALVAPPLDAYLKTAYNLDIIRPVEYDNNNFKEKNRAERVVSNFESTMESA